MNNLEYKELPDQEQQRLETYRSQIDAIDDKLVQLFIERIGIVAEVGRMKRSINPRQCPLRPGREADMVRRIASRFEGSAFSPAAATAMWRTLIGASTAVENDLAISVYAPEGDDALYWIAREYFGPFLNVIRQPHINRVLGDILDGKAGVGLMPELHSADTTHWWVNLLGKGPTKPCIFAHVPFVYYDVPGRREPAALAIGYIKPEATADDVSLWVLEADASTSQHKLQTAFADSSLNAQWVNIHSLRPNSRHHLLMIRGFVDHDNREMQAVIDQLTGSLLQVTYLGSYAVPFKLKFNPMRETA